MTEKPYRQAMGSLIYIAQGTRPDMSEAVSSLSNFNQDPGRVLLGAVKRMLRYLKGTMGHGIMYRRGVSTDFVGFSDASHLSCPYTLRGRAGYVFMCAGGVVSWKSKGVGNNTLSSCETEYAHSVSGMYTGTQFSQHVSI